MEDSYVWPSDLRRDKSRQIASEIGGAQSAERLAGHAAHDLDISPEYGCVYPQRQPGMIELDLSGKLRNDPPLYPAKGALGVARGNEEECNCNVRSDDDIVYDELLDFLPEAYNTFLSLEESSSRRPTAWTSSSSAASAGFDATPLSDPQLAGATKLEQTRRSREAGAMVKIGSCPANGEISVRRTKAVSSILKMIRSLDMLEEDERQEEEERVLKDQGSGAQDGAKQGSSAERLDQVAAKVDSWIANHGQLIGAAYRRGVQSAEQHLKRLSQQLTSYKHHLFEVSRDRQVITTYVRRHEQSWACRHDRLRTELLRLQKAIHELQKSPAQLDENRQMYEGERGGRGGGAAGGGGGSGGGGGGGGGGSVQQAKADDTMDKLLSVIVEHQSRINELKLTVFAQQQHILSLEGILRDLNSALPIEEEDELKHQQEQQQPEDAVAPDAKSRSSRSNPLTKDLQKQDMLEQTADGVSAATTKLTPTLPSSLSSPATASGNFISSKMSDVLLCDEGDYRLCQTNQPEVATDSTLTNIRCLCHQHGVACSSSAHVQLVGQLPYLMDSPLDTEVAGVLARPKARPYSLADLPFVRQSIDQRLTPEQTPADIDFLF